MLIYLSEYFNYNVIPSQLIPFKEFYYTMQTYFILSKGKCVVRMTKYIVYHYYHFNPKLSS